MFVFDMLIIQIICASARGILETIVFVLARGLLNCFHAQLSMKFQLLIKTKSLYESLEARDSIFWFQTLRCCIYDADVGILTFMSMINFMLS